MWKCENVKMWKCPVPKCNVRLSVVCWILCVCAFAQCAAFGSGVIEETLSLASGWNAVYIESTPTNSDATAFWGSLPVTKASCYVSSVYAPTAQLASDGSPISQKPVSHFVWDVNDTANSTMKQIIGGCVYIVFATDAATKTFLGTPQIPHVTWQVSDEGFCTYAPVSIPGGETVSSAVYFGEGLCGTEYAARPYSVWGGDAAAPKITLKSIFSRKPSVEGGKAYAFESVAAGEWPGVLGVSAGLSGGLDFPDGIGKDHFTVCNLGARSREVRVSLASSAGVGDIAPTLYLFVQSAGGAPSRWDEFSATNVTLAAGESRTFVFQCDKSAMADGVNYAAVLAVEDLSGTKMRVRVPVSAAKDAAREGVGAYPAGLWIGEAQMMQVSDAEGNLKNAGGSMKGTLLLHVEGGGRMTLLQRVAVAQEKDADGAWRTMLYRDLDDVPRGTSARRVSSVFIDTANRATLAVANSDTSASAFGREATFRFTVGERSKENPFRHAWHPDHDGKRADYSADSPSGDVPANFIGSIKPESFSVTNQVVFAWSDDNGRSTYSRTPEETTFGRIDWTLTGLTKHPIKMRGLFTLKRVSDAAEIKEEE